MGQIFRFTLLFLLVCMCSASLGFTFTCKEAERKALLQFKHSFIDKSNHLGSWVGEDCCSWMGIGCDNVTGNVIKLDLGRGLFEPYLLKAGEVNSALLELKYLTYLNLSGIDFNGSRIPEFFGSMRQLQHLDLSAAHFSGEVPPHLGNLTNLVILDLSIFQLLWSWTFIAPDLLLSEDASELEANNLEWAFGLEKLQYLDLSGINLTQAHQSLSLLHRLPSLSVLNLAFCGLGNSHTITTWNSTISSSNLQHLDLRFNLFSGPIPDFLQNLTSIKFLDLSANSFNSSIPPWFGKTIDPKYLILSLNSINDSFPHFVQNSSSLTSLDLSHNQFSSSVPSWLANKTYLEYLSLERNHFNRVDGGILGIMGHLCKLRYLDLSDNQFQEEVVESRVNFSSSSVYDLEYLSMRDYKIRSYLPILGSFSSLKFLDLSSTDLEDLPPFFNRFSSLEHLSLSNNNLSGVSPVIGSLSSLKFLDLSYNNLRVVSSLIGNLSSLGSLYLSNNNLETLPPSLGRLSSLSYLDLSYNNLSVVHQVSLANLSSLTDLDISSNSVILDLSTDWMPPFQLESLSILPCKLNSPFPNWVLNQKKISDLDLSDTGISGPLPDNIGIAMPSLSFLRLANNHINGSIPKSLCKVAPLFSLHLQNNSLSGMIPDCWEPNSAIEFMDLSSNKLSGPIPNSLTNATLLYSLTLNNNSIEGGLPLSWTNSIELAHLDLSGNNLHGEIPPWNGVNFPSLQVLILRENKFSGRIPPQLCSIQTLHIINLANNNLVGTIPQCFGSFKMMSSMLHSNASISSTHSPSIDRNSKRRPLMDLSSSDLSALEVVKGQEREYTTILDKLVNMDLSCNQLVGVIPAEIASLSLLNNLNLSHNHLMGNMPMEMGKMKSLESLDLSSNNLSGSIPESITSLDFLSDLNLSFNNLHGPIPTGRHLETLDDPSIYMGNPGLCGGPLIRQCSRGDSGARPPTSTVLEVEEDNKHEKMWFYMVIMLGFATGFWGVIGICQSCSDEQCSSKQLKVKKWSIYICNNVHSKG